MSITRLDTALTYTTQSINDRLDKFEETVHEKMDGFASQMKTFTTVQTDTGHEVARLGGYLEMIRRREFRQKVSLRNLWWPDPTSINCLGASLGLYP